MKEPIKFGTDGWRAVIAEDFTFDNVRACTQGVADYLKEAGLAGRGLVIGYDNRFASEDFAAAAAEVAAGNNIKAKLCPKAAPTPVISYGVLAEKAGGGIIITASHNPAIWNGFKFKDENGSSAAGETTARIEALIAKAQESGKINHMPLAEAKAQDLVTMLDLDPIYFEQVKRLVDLEALRQAGLKIVVDPMFGAGIGYMESMLGGGTNKLLEINSQRNPLFPGIQPEPIAANLVKLSETVREQGAGVGLALDGDADRMGIVDEKGTFLTQLQVYALLALYLLEIRGERGPIIKTLTTTNMLFRLGELYNVPVYETMVGFKYVAPLMLEHDAIIGGEESGGYGFRGHVAERDGVLANLYFLDLMMKTGKNPSQLIEYLYEKVGPHYYQRVDIKFPAEEREDIIARVRDKQPPAIDNIKVARINSSDGYRFDLEDNSWLLIRFSGTEPILRIYTETDSPDRVARFLELGKQMAGV